MKNFLEMKKKYVKNYHNLKKKNIQEIEYDLNNIDHYYYTVCDRHHIIKILIKKMSF